MRIVVSPSDVAHLWANQHQDEAKTANRNFYFYKDKIYSYGSHFCIAKHETNKAGEHAILFTTRGYSSSTSKHIQVTRNACWGRIIYCAFPEGSDEKNFDDFERKILEISNNLPNARKPEKYIAQIEYQNSLIGLYAEFKGVKVPKKLQKLMLIADKDSYTKILGKRAEAIKRDKAKLLKLRQQQEKERLQKFQQEDLPEWRNFDKLYIDSKGVTGFDVLRFNPSTEVIETSQAIKIERESAKRIYHIIKQSIDGRINKPEKILDFRVLQITPELIEVGCHKIKMEEIEMIAKQLHFND